MNSRRRNLESSSNYSIFKYLYRDAANWKTWGELLLRGTLTAADIERIESRLEGGEFFIPEQIGMKPLPNVLFAPVSIISQNDHVWHEFVAVRVATDEEISRLTVWGTTATLLELFDSVSDWKIECSQRYAAIYAQAVANIDVLKMQSDGAA